MNKKNLIGFVVLLSIFSISFIIAGHIAELGSSFTVNEDVYNVFNITVNNTGESTNNNITVVTITLPSIFSFGANDSTGFGTNTIAVTRTNTSTSITWTNDTEYLINGSTNNSYFWFNASISTAGFTNITVTTTNGSGTYSSNVSLYVNDTTFPLVSFDSLVFANGGNYSGTLNINASIDEDTPSTVFFNITNATSGAQTAIYTAARQGTGTYWNATVSLSSLTDGLYNITIYANDSNNQLNSSVFLRQVRFDSTNPTVTFSCTPDSVAIRAQVSCTCSGTDGGAGVNTTTYYATPTTANDGTFTETCTVTDLAGNSASATDTYTVTTSTGGSSASSGGSSSTQTWTNTYTATEDILKTGYTKSLKAKERVKVRVINEDHYVGIKSVTTSAATIEIASDPIEITLDIGEDAKADVNKDGTYDLYVKLNNIVNGNADITITKIEEKVQEGEESVTTTGEITPSETETPEETPTKYSWYWILGGIVIIAVLVGLGYKFKPKSKKKK